MLSLLTELLLELGEEADIDGCCCREALIGGGGRFEGGNDELFVRSDDSSGVSCEIVGNVVVKGEEITSSFAGERPVLRGADCGEDDGDGRGEVTTVTGVVHVVCVAAAGGGGVDREEYGKVCSSKRTWHEAKRRFVVGSKHRKALCVKE